MKAEIVIHPGARTMDFLVTNATPEELEGILSASASSQVVEQVRARQAEMQDEMNGASSDDS